jgi:hypothetical protein
MAWHGRKRAHLYLLFFLYLKVTYEIGEQLELQAVFYMYPTVGTRQVEVPGVLMAFLLLVFWRAVVLS